MPSRSRLLVPSKVLSAPRPVELMPFSPCRLPTGTTRLELVTSGRSVAISEPGDGHSPAHAAVADRSDSVTTPDPANLIIVIGSIAGMPWPTAHSGWRSAKADHSLQ